MSYLKKTPWLRNKLKKKYDLFQKDETNYEKAKITDSCYYFQTKWTRKFYLKNEFHFFEHLKQILRQYFPRKTLFLNSSANLMQVDNLVNCINYQAFTQEFYV